MVSDWVNEYFCVLLPCISQSCRRSLNMIVIDSSVVTVFIEAD